MSLRFTPQPARAGAAEDRVPYPSVNALSGARLFARAGGLGEPGQHGHEQRAECADEAEREDADRDVRGGNERREAVDPEPDEHSVLLFDVPGESLSNIMTVAEQAKFVLLCEAVIVLLDPQKFLPSSFDDSAVPNRLVWLLIHVSLS